jgi:hypothetical protein
MDSPVPFSDRRASVRRRPKRTVTVACRLDSLGIGPNIALGLLDISEDGLRLLVRPALEPSQRLNVSLESLWLQRPLLREIEIIWCMPTADGTHCVGARFSQRLNVHELQAVASVD